MSSCPNCYFCKLWHWHIIFGTWVSPWEDVSSTFIILELWHHGKIYRVYEMVSCSGLSFFVLWHSHTLFCMSFMNSVWPWPLTSISKLYFHNEFESGKMSLLFDVGTPNFCIWVHVSPWDMLCTFSTLVWLWPICGWRGVSLVSFTHSFYLVVLREYNSISFCKLDLYGVYKSMDYSFLLKIVLEE